MSGEDWRWLTAFVLTAVVALAPSRCDVERTNGWGVHIERDTDEQIRELLAPKR